MQPPLITVQREVEPVNASDSRGRASDSVIRWYMTRKVCSYCSILLAYNSAWSPSLFLQTSVTLPDQ